MEDDEIDIKIIKFSDYLMEFGLLNNSCYKEFLKKFKEISENEILSSGNEETDKNIGLIYFKENISKTMIEFYKSMPEERKKLLALNIYSKYNKKIEEEKKNVINIDELLGDKYVIKYTEYEIESLPPINIIANNNKNNKSYYNESNILNYKIEKYKNDKNKKMQSNYINNKRNNSFIEHKPNDVLNINKNNNKNMSPNKNCTFQPNSRNNSATNKNTIKKNLSFNKSNNPSVFDRLYKISEKKKKDIEYLNKELNKENIFQPNLKKNNSKILKRENFDERLKFLEEQKKIKEKIKKEEEEKEFQAKFPFNPKTYNTFNNSNKKNKNNNNNNISIHQKLYEDNIKIKEKNEERIKLAMDEIKKMSNHPISIHNNIQYLYNNNNNKNKIKIERSNSKRSNSKSNSKRNNKKLNHNNSSEKNLSYKKNKKYKNDYHLYKMEENKKCDHDNINDIQKIEELYNEYKKLKEAIDMNNIINYNTEN